MTKTDIVEILAKGTGLTQHETAAVVDGFLSTVSYALKNGDRVELRGFGTFCLRERKAKQTPNPKTGKMMFIPHRMVPDFKPSGHLKEEVLKALKESGQFKSDSEKPRIGPMGELELFDLDEQSSQQD